MSARLRHLHAASRSLRTGDVERAASACRSVLRRYPSDADALALMAQISAREGGSAAAIQWYSHAIQQAGPRAELCAGLARALDAQGHPESAIACYLQAIEATPRDPELWLALGLQLSSMGRVEAESCFRQTLELSATADQNAEAHMRLGHMFHSRGDWTGAAECYELARRDNPASAEANYNLGVMQTMLNRQSEARICYQEALRLKPDYAEAHNNLAILEQLGGEPEQAVRSYRQAIRACPGYQDPYYNLGLLLQDQERPEEALDCYEELAALNPTHADGFNNHGNALLALNRVAEARAAYERAVQLRPGHTEAHWNLALVYLLTGDYANGWREYDWRLLRDPDSARQFDRPLWDGSPFKGRTLLVHSEQGLGDTIQFVRYLSLAKERGGDVLFLCQKPLDSVLASCAGIDEICLDPPPNRDFDVHIPLLSLPRVFGTTLETVPARIPYVRSDRRLAWQWSAAVKARCEAKADLRIGLVWRGNPNHKNDRNRSAPEWLVESLGAPVGMTLFSLQKGGVPVPRNLVPLGEELQDFADTAAVISNMDLIVSVDTAVAHLAGSMGHSAWTMLPFAPDWRWMLDREDSPWYPGMRLIRQERRKDWESIARELRSSLHRLQQSLPVT